MLDASFHPGGGIDSITQQGSVAYQDGERKAWGGRATYTPADQILVLTGSPQNRRRRHDYHRRTMRMNRTTGDAFAEGDVKSTYSDLKPQPGGALLASSDPIHVTSRSMTAHSTPAIALYSGDARLWQDANVIEAPGNRVRSQSPLGCRQGIALTIGFHRVGSDGKEWKSHSGKDHLLPLQLHRQRTQSPF